MSETQVVVDVSRGVARIELSRPEAANTIDLDVAKGLARAARRLRDDPAVRAVLLTGAGGVFCAGGDLKAFARSDDLPALLREITSHLHEAVSELVRLEAPLVVAVEGSAAGAGLGLVSAGDLVVASESARFVMAYTAVGLTPDGSSSWFLPRLVGERRAMELVLTNRVLDAGEALDWGLVTSVVRDGETAEAGAELARSLAAGPMQAFGAAKRLVRSAWTRGLEPHLAAESEELARAAGRHDAHEGIAAFLEKRPPCFDGM
ncbi:MAG: 1,2-epoxyphenylacetyl-CoA isomerase [Acidimicrobiales bacterium]|nr:MAG: enoyl-CoA hydratase [Actinomycetota bacterium]MBV6510005.1 1,2-epoxyphenylacetyl-CoA isomerase [Acidimicrobiales bacterium]RIK04304.1 MAG: enoyl-CoA hydratase [Acidobacteriota bacterium]